MSSSPPHRFPPATRPSLSALGYRLPAEWERHEATWLAWPHGHHDWPDKWPIIDWVFGEIARKLAPGEEIRVLVPSPAQRRRAQWVLQQAGADRRRLRFYLVPTDRGWMRDTGPLFVTRKGAAPRRVIVWFHYNAWARYSNWRRDAAIPRRLGRRLGIPLHRPEEAGRPIVLEGGSIDVNGRGVLLTTEECLLHRRIQVRNPGVGRSRIEEILRSTLGIKKVFWLGRGIAGDDTHGHVDDLCRFVNRRTVVYAVERNPRDVNYRALQENRERLQDLRLEDGSRPELIPLPMPAPLYYGDRRLPASYANFYIGNAAVLMPTFNDANDRAAMGILAELITDRPVIGLHAVDLVLGRGTVHCLTQQQPAV